MKKPRTVAVPVVSIDIDAHASPETREVGSALVWLCQDGRDEEVIELMMGARNALARRVHGGEGARRGDGEGRDGPVSALRLTRLPTGYWLLVAVPASQFVSRSNAAPSRDTTRDESLAALPQPLVSDERRAS